MNGGGEALLKFFEPIVKRMDDAVLSLNVKEEGQFSSLAILKAESQGARTLLAALNNKITEIEES